jgi:putative oxidoreductase
VTAMSATSPTFHDDVFLRRRGYRRYTWVDSVFGTHDSYAPTVARLGLGLVMFPHGAQKVLGWFGGGGFAQTYGFFTGLGMPGWLAITAIVTELAASVLLVFGALTRLAALGIFAILASAVVLVHWPYGFFMNWTGTKPGEGFEYHLLGIGLALVCLIAGGGKASVDQSIALRE